MKTFDIAVLGGGPGGYVAAIRASKEGRSVALIEADQLGGTCLNRGCIPSKTLLRHAEVIEQIRKAEKWGIQTGGISFSLEMMMERKNQVIQQLRSGISSLLKANKIVVYQGFGEVQPDRSIHIRTQDGQEKIKAENIIIATGSGPVVPNIPGIEQTEIHTSDSIFDIQELPSSLAIIGGGVIGIEFACIFANLNVDVTIIEKEDRIIATEDKDASKEMHKSLKRKGVEILTCQQVVSLSRSGEQTEVTIKNSDGKTEKRTFDEILMAIGRKPNMNGVESLNLEMNGPFIKVNDRMETSMSNIYAVGDVIGGYQLAHVASAEGLIAAENAATNKIEVVDYKAVPRCIYTFPEVASVGYSEQEAEKQGYRIKKATFPLRTSGKAMAMGEDEGFIKVISDEQYGEILGVVMVGAHATEMISEAAAYIFLEGTVEELARMIHPHPSLNEGIFESANTLIGKGIHML